MTVRSWFLLLVLLSIVLKVRTKDGTLVVQVNQPDAEVSVDNGKVTIKSTQAMSLESQAKASVKGTAGLSLDGTSQAELKAAQVSVNGSGMTEVKGGLVKIN